MNIQKSHQSPGNAATRVSL